MWYFSLKQNEVLFLVYKVKKHFIKAGASQLVRIVRLVQVGKRHLIKAGAQSTRTSRTIRSSGETVSQMREPTRCKSQLKS